MATATRSIAASAQTLPPFCVGDSQPVRRRGTAQANTLPAWAQSSEARALLAAIKLEQPRRANYDATGFEVRQYVGPNAAKLRQLFDRTFQQMMNDVEALRRQVAPGMPQSAEYRAAHDGLAKYARENGADVLIARVLGDAS